MKKLLNLETAIAVSVLSVALSFVSVHFSSPVIADGGGESAPTWEDIGWSPADPAPPGGGQITDPITPMLGIEDILIAQDLANPNTDTEYTEDEIRAAIELATIHCEAVPILQSWLTPLPPTDPDDPNFPAPVPSP